MAANQSPEGYNSITPYLSIKGAKDAIAFYKQAFGAVEIFRLEAPNGDIGHADIMIGDSHLMMAEPCDESPTPSPESLQGSTVGLYLYVEDVDAVFEQAVEAGATAIRPPADQFYGDRTGTLKDPFGHVWYIGTQVEQLEPDEIHKRAEALFSSESS